MRTPESLDQYKFLRNKSIKIINKKQRDFFRKNCSEINENTREGEVWKLVSSMEGRQKQGPNTVILKDSGGRDVISNKDKAELLGKHYENISADSNLDNEFLMKKNRHKISNPHLFRKQNNSIDPINNDFNLQELLGTLRTKKTSAPGEDGISYDILKNIHIFGLKEILRLFNTIWNSGSIPKIFKHAIVVPILKPNKPKSDPASYRPISLTSHLGKVLETMFTNRLQQKLEAYRKLNKLQSGFRKKRQTLDQLARLIHNAEKCRNMNKTTLAVLLDLEKAFDLLWREGALEALQKLNVTGRAYNYIQDFLTDRTFQVRVGESLSDSKTQENGVPQGAVLSPTIFNILIDAVATIPDIFPHVDLGQFADDTALWIKALDCPDFGPEACNKLREKIRKPLEKLLKILRDIGFKVNVKKTQVIFFNRPRKGREYIKINDKTIESSDSVTYLGMTLDTKLTYSEHIDNLINKGEKGLNILRKISGSTWGLHCSSRLLLYKNYILPKLVYGEEFFDKASITSLEKLQKFQNKALSVVSNTRKSLPIAARHYLCQLPPLAIRRKFKAIHLYNRLQYNKENPTNTIFTDAYQNTTHYRNKNKIKVTFTESIRKLLNDNNLQAFKVNSLPKPIEYWAIKGIKVDTTLSHLINHNTPKTEKLHHVIHHLRTKYANYTHVYCDGAKNRFSGQTGIGFYDISNDKEYKARLNPHLKIESVEVAAVSYSTKYVNDYLSSDNCLILSDSLNACKHLNEYCDTNHRLDIINSIHRLSHNIKIHHGTVTILWIPAHIDLAGHDRADQLAKEGMNCNNVHNINYSIDELKIIIESGYTVPAVQSYWAEARTGNHGRDIIPNFFSSININNLTKKNSTTQMLIRLIFGTAEFYIGRNRACADCNANLSIEHAVMNCKLFDETRNRIRDTLRQHNKELTLKSILEPKCHTSIKEYRNILVNEIHTKFTI